MTVDVEDYFQVSAFDGVVPRNDWDRLESRVVANTTRVLDLFDQAGIKATFFVLGWVAQRYPALVRAIAGQRHEIASHGFNHQLIYTQTPDEFRDDVRRSKGTLEDITGCRIAGYRAPSFSIIKSSMWALDVLAEEGYLYDTSIFPVRHDRYGVPDAPRHSYQVPGGLLELPPSTVRISGTNLPIAGGGYFRLMPYTWTRWGIHRLNTRERRPAVFYLHPWEVDPEQPRFNVGRATRVRHYYNLHRTADRLMQLMRDFTFGTAASVLKLREPQLQERLAPVASGLRHA
jgi:polysaccharide deacetylase family protein (PEP-CTERM system associated)